jgi:hypothetical protein
MFSTARSSAKSFPGFSEMLARSDAVMESVFWLVCSALSKSSKGIENRVCSSGVRPGRRMVMFGLSLLPSIVR